LKSWNIPGIDAFFPFDSKNPESMASNALMLAFKVIPRKSKTIGYFEYHFFFRKKKWK